MSSPPPIPGQPLAYASEYVDTRRPGIIIAMGVLSLVFALFGFLSTVFVALLAIGLTAGSVRSTSSAVAPAAPVLSSPDGIGPAQRALLIERAAELIPLTSARRMALDRFLESSGRQVDPRARSLASAELAARVLTAARKIDEDSDQIDFTSGRLTLFDSRALFEPIGTTDVIKVDLSTAPTALAPVTGTRMTPVVVSGTSISILWSSSLVSGGLAILLLFAGILTLRYKPLGRRLHLWWAVLKLGGAVLGAFAIYSFYDATLRASTPPGTPNVGAWQPIAVIMAVFTFLLAILYPIAVLIVMNLRSVKNYLSSVN